MTNSEPRAAATPLVSVIIPSYNHAPYIGETIASVAAQSHPRVQIVVIDDGSSDGSIDLLRGFASRGTITLIEQANTGVCKALNRAIREGASGDFIALLGSDDLWHPDKLRLQLEALASDHAAEFCFSQAQRFGSGIPEGRGKIFPARCARGDILGTVALRQHVPAGTMLFTRRLYDELGGFDETLLEEDWDFVMRCAAATRVTAVERPLMHYRIHASNIMRTRSRAAIFQQKAKILAKNFDLFSPTRWLGAVLLHYAHDIVWSRFRR